MADLGRPFKYTADQLDQVFEEYKVFVPQQKFIKKEYNQKLDIVRDIELNRPPTIYQFCTFAGITNQTYCNILNRVSDNLDTNLFESLTRVNDYIKEYQVSGAMLNELNPNIVARLNGITETVNINNSLSVAALPVAIQNNVIDLTDQEFELLD